MQALVYHRSVPAYLASRALSRWRPHCFFAAVAPLRLRDVPLSVPDGWATLRVRLCGLCGSDVNLLRGAESYLMEPYASFPAILGHEIVAEVETAPPGSAWKTGDRVVVDPLLPCETRGLPPCRFCGEGEPNLCEHFTGGRLAAGPVTGYNRAAGGGMAECVAAHPRQLIALPAQVTDDVAVLTDSLASALQAALDHFPADRDTVVVYGAGIIGQHVVRALRSLGSAARIGDAARHGFQQELARQGGASVALGEAGRAVLAEAVGGRWLPSTLGGGNVEGGADLFFDCAGTRQSLQEGLVLLRGRGRYVLVATVGDIGPVDLSSLWFRQLTLTGSFAYASGSWKGQRQRTYQRAIALLAGGAYPHQGLLTHTFPLSAYRQAFQAAFDKRRYKSMKVALDLRNQP